MSACEKPLRSYCIRAGELLEQRGRYREAICFYQRACSLSQRRRLNVFEEINDLSNLGYAYKKEGHYHYAYRCYRRGMSMLHNATVEEIKRCGGGDEWMATRHEIDFVYEECKNHNKSPSGRKTDLHDMLNTNLVALVEEMTEWTGTDGEFTRELDEYSFTQEVGSWFDAIERQYTSKRASHLHGSRKK